MKRKIAQVVANGGHEGSKKGQVVGEKKKKQSSVQEEPKAAAASNSSAGGGLTKSQKKRQRKRQRGQEDRPTAPAAAAPAQETAKAASKQQTKPTDGAPKKGTQQQKQQQGAKPKAEPAATELFASPESCLQWLLGSAMPVERFFAEHWEKKPLLVKRKERRVGDGTRLTTDLFSFATFERLFNDTNRPLLYTKNFNVCRYEDGVKKMLNPEGQASLKQVRKFWREGATFQFFQPQQHSEVLHRMVAGLEQYFGALVGANIYMTPPNAQGLAPHYDDVEVFILQLEGKKKWKLYSPPPSDELPREYSRDLDQEECGEPLMEIEVEEGDLLYFPRGTIHQACTGPSASTHVTISTYQRHSWGDFLTVALPLAIKEAIDEDVEFRRGLPVDYLTYMGATFAPDDKQASHEAAKSTGKKGSSRAPKGLAAKQQQFEAKVVSLLHRLSGHLLLHKAADVSSLDFVNHRLPPASLCYAAAPQDEAQGKAKKANSNKKPQQQQQQDDVQIRVEETQILDDDSSIRLAEPNFVRLVVTTADEDEERANAAEQAGMLEGENESEEDSEAEDLPPASKKASGGGKQHAMVMEEADDDEDDDEDEGSEEGEEDEDEDEDEGSVLLYHSLRNPAELHMSGHRNEPSLLRFPLNHLPALKHLLASYPNYVPVASLPGLDHAQAMHLAIALGVEGLLQTSNAGAK